MSIYPEIPDRKTRLSNIKAMTSLLIIMLRIIAKK
jgi:hypothetical protein